MKEKIINIFRVITYYPRKIFDKLLFSFFLSGSNNWELLEEYFSREDVAENGLLSVHDIAQQLNLTSDYLSSMLKNLTGQTTQQHIHHKVIEMAKVKLSVTNSSVSEIAYSLGFEHPQSFSKFFKSKTKQTPLEFRTSFN